MYKYFLVFVEKIFSSCVLIFHRNKTLYLSSQSSLTTEASLLSVSLITFFALKDTCPSQPNFYQWRMFFFPFWGEVQPSPLLLRRLLAYWVWSNRWNAWQRKPKYWEKTCPIAALSTTNPTCPDQVSNSGHRCGKPVTNCPNYGTALVTHIDSAGLDYDRRGGSRKTELPCSAWILSYRCDTRICGGLIIHTNLT
jgi:hypothetical protein